MNYREAFSAAILGDAVRAVDMAEGTFVKYEFAGMRIYHAGGGASSGWMPRDHDMNVEWEVVPNEHEDAYKVRLAEAEAAKSSKWGKPIYPEFDAAKHVERGSPLDQGDGKAIVIVHNPTNSQAWGRALRPVPPGPVVVKDWALDDDVPKPVADPWGRPANVGTPTPPAAPKRDSWGRLIPGE